MKTLNHKDKFIIDGIKCRLFTLAGYAAEDGKTVKEFFEEYPEQLKEDNRPSGISTGSALCSNAGYYEAEKAKWADAVTLENGEHVVIEGEEYITVFKGRYSNAVVFNKLEK